MPPSRQQLAFVAVQVRVPVLGLSLNAPVRAQMVLSVPMGLRRIIEATQNDSDSPPGQHLLKPAAEHHRQLTPPSSLMHQ